MKIFTKKITGVLVYKCGEIVVSKMATEVIKMKYAKKRSGNELGGEVYNRN